MFYDVVKITKKQILKKCIMCVFVENYEELKFCFNKRGYACPPQFVRLSNSCYLLSKQVLSWQDAHHYCRDMNSHLASLETLWEDENMRSYLNRKELGKK
jgi:hypothetical protein